MNNNDKRMTNLEPERLETLLYNSLMFMYDEFYSGIDEDQFRSDLQYQIGFTESELAKEAKPLIRFLDDQPGGDDCDSSRFYEEINGDDE